MISKPDISGKLAIDARGLDQLRQSAKQDAPDALRATAEQFESLFMNMVLKSMRDATPHDGPFDSEQEKTFTSMLDQQLSQNMAKRGVGLADVLVRQLSHGGVKPVAPSLDAPSLQGSPSLQGAPSTPSLQSAPSRQNVPSLQSALNLQSTQRQQSTPGLHSAFNRETAARLQSTSIAPSAQNGLNLQTAYRLQSVSSAQNLQALKAFSGAQSGPDADNGIGIGAATATANNDTDPELRALAPGRLGYAARMYFEASRLKLSPATDSIETAQAAVETGRSRKSHPLHVQQFQDRLSAHAEQASRETGIPAKFMIGQAALESGWGKKEIITADGQRSHNLFGIKATGSWQGKVVEAVTTEYMNGVAHRKTEKFRAYDSYADGFKDYARLLTQNPRYEKVISNSQDASSFAQGLQKAGYATDPNYAAKLTSIINNSLS
jgi:flagellar protein FlgJ